MLIAASKRWCESHARAVRKRGYQAYSTCKMNDAELWTQRAVGKSGPIKLRCCQPLGRPDRSIQAFLVTCLVTLPTRNFWQGTSGPE